MNVEQDQESFLRLTNPAVEPQGPGSSVGQAVTPSPHFKSTTINPAANFDGLGSVGAVSNNIFPATLVGSSMNFGGSPTAHDQNRLPPGSAGFGTVEAVDIGGVSIQSGLIQTKIHLAYLYENGWRIEKNYQKIAYL